MNGNIKLGKLLCDQDIITKRQLNKALQSQVKGDKRTIGEILVELGYCEFDDITDALLGSDEILNIMKKNQKKYIPNQNQKTNMKKKNR